LEHIHEGDLRTVACHRHRPCKVGCILRIHACNVAIFEQGLFIKGRCRRQRITDIAHARLIAF
jgi:hypothetical protein